MIAQTLTTRDLFLAVDETLSEFRQLVSSFSQEELNAVPFSGSWKAGEVAEHITKSNASIAQALNANGYLPERERDERAGELKATFLDFTAKFKSPDFVLPTQSHYNKDALTAALKRSIEALKEAGSKANLREAIMNPALGEITKLELLYLVLFHTKRHIRQLQNIFRIVAKN